MAFTVNIVYNMVYVYFATYVCVFGALTEVKVSLYVKYVGHAKQ